MSGAEMAPKETAIETKVTLTSGIWVSPLSLRERPTQGAGPPKKGWGGTKERERVARADGGVVEEVVLAEGVAEDEEKMVVEEKVVCGTDGVCVMVSNGIAGGAGGVDI